MKVSDLTWNGSGTDMRHPMANSSARPKRRRFWRLLRGWWLRPLYQAAVMITAVAFCIYLVGWAQRYGWLQVEQVAFSPGNEATTASATTYICPMMCVPPTTEPGRCPVCAMELVPATADAPSGGEKSVTIATADRRLVGIETVAAERTPATRRISAVGVLEIDESRLARIPADSDGRVEELFFNFTGQEIQMGQTLATYYSPELYSAQTELLTLKQTRRNSTGERDTLKDVREQLIGAARMRLRELGMSSDQIQSIEQAGTAQSRIKIQSPQSGTIIKLMLREGEYLKAGELVCEVADLSSIWLVTHLFPEDAALVHYGQRVEARISSLPGEAIDGRVSFVAPTVDAEKRAIRVRIDLANPNGQLRPGDEATVAIEVPAQPGAAMYDEQLAGMWICPQHPDEIQKAPGTCSRSQRKLVPTSKFGFVASESEVQHPLTIPRNAVLKAGDRSAVYVEVESGEFEMRLVTLGSNLGERVVVLDGIAEAEQVATDGNFLIDSQMQLSGKPSLIDPSRAAVPNDSDAAADDDWEIEPPEFGEIEAVDDVDLDREAAEELPRLSVESLESESSERSMERPQDDTNEDDDWALPDFDTLEVLDPQSCLDPNSPGMIRTASRNNRRFG